MKKSKIFEVDEDFFERERRINGSEDINENWLRNREEWKLWEQMAQLHSPTDRESAIPAERRRFETAWRDISAIILYNYAN